MKTLCALLAAAACSLAAPAGAAPPILDNNFDGAGSLAGWQLINNSSPAGMNWFRGNPGVFSAQSGPADGYVAASFLSASGNGGTVDNWLITPELTLAGPTQLSFYTRSAGTPGFHDMLEVRFDPGDGGGFGQLLMTVGQSSVYPSAWQRYDGIVNYTGSGRFAFRYTGPADSADYIGLDTLSVAAVPEPETWLMLLAGLAVVAVRKLGGWRRAGAATRALPAGPRAGARRHAIAGALPPGLAYGGCCLLAVAATLSILAWTPPALAQQQEQQRSGGVIAVRDQETGALRPATPAEFQALHRQQQTHPPGPHQVIQRPDGTRQARVSGMRVFDTVERGPDGQLRHACTKSGPDLHEEDGHENH